MIPNPIFIIGTERSGSNLLRLILNAHANIAVPHPPHIMRDFSPLLPFYGDLGRDRNFSHLLTDVVRVVNGHFSPWPFLVKESEVRKRLPAPTLYGIYCAIYEQFREYAAKPRWGCKSTFMFSQAEEIIRAHETPKFIHLVRDPRAVAASAKKSIFSSYQPEVEARLWLEQQRSIAAKLGKVFHSENYYLLKYEDLVCAPELSIRGLMDFLGESFAAQQLEFFQTAEAKELSSLSESWQNCQSPIDASRANHFFYDLSEKEIEIVETTTKHEMKKFGYSLATAANSPESSRLKLTIQEIALQLKAESRSLVKDKNFYGRWKKKAILKQIYWKRKWSNRLSPLGLE
jgi:hypothetical protein